jgi:PIN domain nuclease of toxin-antitoxin system
VTSGERLRPTTEYQKIVLSEQYCGLLDNGNAELAISSKHAVVIGSLPPLHRDPFDWLLMAQSMIEGITLLTADPLVPQ